MGKIIEKDVFMFKGDFSCFTQLISYTVNNCFHGYRIKSSEDHRSIITLQSISLHCDPILLSFPPVHQSSLLFQELFLKKQMSQWSYICQIVHIKKIKPLSTVYFDILA